MPLLLRHAPPTVPLAPSLRRRWDPLTQAVFGFVRSRGVATFPQIDTHMRTHFKHLISGGRGGRGCLQTRDDI